MRPVFEATDGVDGWVSLEVSPLLADDTAKTIRAAARQHAAAARPNLFIKIPGTPAGLPAIEESIFAGVPVNVTLLFSREQYLAAAEAYLRGIERRIAAGLDPKVGSVASLFVSRWDVAVKEEVSPRHRATASASRLRCAPTRRTAICLHRRAGKGSRSPAPVRSACSGPAPAPRTRRPPTRSTSRRSRRPIRSTRCRRRPCMRSPTTARSARRCRSTAATPRRCSRNSGAKASTTRHWPHACSAKAPMPSRSRGPRCCRASREKSSQLAEAAFAMSRDARRGAILRAALR